MNEYPGVPGGECMTWHFLASDKTQSDAPASVVAVFFHFYSRLISVSWSPLAPLLSTLDSPIAFSPFHPSSTTYLVY